MGSTLRGKNLLLGSKFISLRVDPIEKKSKKKQQLADLLTAEGVLVHLQTEKVLVDIVD